MVAGSPIARRASVVIRVQCILLLSKQHAKIWLQQRALHPRALPLPHLDGASGWGSFWNGTEACCCAAVCVSAAVRSWPIRGHCEGPLRTPAGAGQFTLLTASSWAVGTAFPGSRYSSLRTHPLFALSASTTTLGGIAPLIDGRCRRAGVRYLFIAKPGTAFRREIGV